jgi:hypothetical protein
LSLIREDDRGEGGLALGACLGTMRRDGGDGHGVSIGRLSGGGSAGWRRVTVGWGGEAEDRASVLRSCGSPAARTRAWRRGRRGTPDWSGCCGGRRRGRLKGRGRSRLRCKRLGRPKGAWNRNDGCREHRGLCRSRCLMGPRRRCGGRRGRRDFDPLAGGREGSLVELPRGLESFGEPFGLFGREIAILGSPIFAHIRTFCSLRVPRGGILSKVSSKRRLGSLQVPNWEIRRSSKSSATWPTVMTRSSNSS